MFGDLDKYIAVFITGLLVSFLLTPLVRRLATRVGAVDLPNERRAHRTPTPRGGGMAVVLAVHAACFVALAFPWGTLSGGLDIQWWRHFALASLVLLALGIIDDLRGLRPSIKLCGQALAAWFVALSGARFGDLLGIQLPQHLDTLLVVVWIVCVINAFNLIDGLDGLATGLAIISSIGLCGIFILGKVPGNVLVLLGLIGACIGFLRYNFHPASIFLGDTGSMFLGFILGAVSLQTSTKSTFLISLAIPFLVIGVPIYDEVLAVWRRSVRLWLKGDPSRPGSKRSGIMQPDLEHIHHRLSRAGLSARRVALMLCGLNLLFVVFGLLLTLFKSHTSGIFLLALLAAVYVLMRHLAAVELRDTGTAILNGLHSPNHAILKGLAYPAWDMACLAAAVAMAMKVVDEPGPTFWHEWFLQLPIWVTPTFSLLAISRVYLTVWTRARGLDVLMLLFQLAAGSALSLGIALLIDPANAGRSLALALFVAAVAHPAIVGVRVFYRLAEEFVVHLRNKSELRPHRDGVVLYGAGHRCQLFLKERSYGKSSCYDGHTIAGLVDDERTLHFQWIYGYKVLGGLNDLPQLIMSRRIAVIVITASLRRETRVALEKIVAEYNVELSEWSFGNRLISGSHTDDLSRAGVTGTALLAHDE